MIKASKEIAIKNIDAKIEMGKEIIANQRKMVYRQQKAQSKQLDYVHNENMEKIKTVKEMIKNKHEKDLKQIDGDFKLDREKIRNEHDQKLALW